MEGICVLILKSPLENDTIAIIIDADLKSSISIAFHFSQNCGILCKLSIADKEN